MEENIKKKQEYEFKSCRYFISDLKSKVCNELIDILSKEKTENDAGHLIIGSVNGKREEESKNLVKEVHTAVKRVVDDQKIQFMTQLILESDVIIYDLNTCDLDQAELAIKTLKIRDLSEKKILIVISSVMVWEDSEAKEKKEEQENIEGEGEAEEEDINEEGMSEEGLNELENEKEEKQDKEDQQEEEQKKQYVKFTDKDYYLRVARQEKYERMKSLETLCISASISNKNLQSYVLCSGIQYGLGEDIFYEYFKQSWLQEPSNLVIYGKGNNRIPMIHTSDLATFIKKVQEVLPIQKYILAVDNNKRNKLKRIVESIAKGLGTGMTIKNQNIDLNYKAELGLNLMMKASSVFDKFNNENNNEEEEVEEEEGNQINKKVKYRFKFEWLCKDGIQSKIQTVIEQFNQFHKLKPIKIFVQGQPAIGKTHLSRQLAIDYNIPHLHIKSIITEALALQSEWGEELRNVFNEQKEKLIEQANEQLEKLREFKEKNNLKILPEDEIVDESKLDIRMPDQQLFAIIKWKLQTNQCQNRGYVLDAYPKSYKQCQQIFLQKKKRINDEGIEEEVEEEEQQQEEEENKNLEENQKEFKTREINKNISPDSVIILNSLDKSIIYKRIQGLSQEQIQNTHWNEKDLNRRFQEYDRINKDVQQKGAKVIQDFFIENQIQIKELIIKQDEIGSEAQNQEQSDILNLAKQFIERNGAFNNYQNHHKIQEKERQLKVQQSIKDIEEKHKQYIILKNQQEEEQRQLVNEEYKMAIQETKKQDRKTLEIMSSPLEKYLNKYVIPYLVEGFQKLSEQNSKDGLDTLAEFLFTKSQELKSTQFNL